MKIKKTYIDNLFVLESTDFKDKRGYFFENFRKDFHQKKLKTEFVQENESLSLKGVLRGLHFQKPPHEQAKLVRVVKGEILDVAVDLRPKSKTYLKHFSILINDQNKIQLFIPKGFAHGFVVLSDYAIVNYKVDNYYNKTSESGLLYNDPLLKIDWKYPNSSLIISEKDLKYKNIKINK